MQNHKEIVLVLLAGFLFLVTQDIARPAAVLANSLEPDIHQDQDDEENTLVDDWQYSISSLGVVVGVSPGFKGALLKNSTISGNVNARMSQRHIQASSKGATYVGSLGMQSLSVNSANLGFTVGGAMDTDNFYQNLENGYLPKYDSITYEGTFSNYYFDTGLGNTPCRELFCPSYARAINRDLYSGNTAYYLSVGLNSGLTEKSFQRKKLNLMVVLDISGSMDSPFNRYSYDPGAENNQEEKAGTKMQLANQAIVAMMKHLKPEDRFGVVLFDNTAYKAKPLRLVGRTDMKAIAGHILDVTSRGGTNWSAGYSLGEQQFSSLAAGLKDPELYENRIVFITDAMPNSGELGRDPLLAMIKNASAQGIYTSVIGVGVDFNPDLVNYITRVRGANYYTVHNAGEFKKRLADEFDFMVTPLVFDLEMTLSGSDFTIEGVYGSPEADQSTGRVMRINTLFPSPAEEGQVKGGVVLVKLKKTGSGNTPVRITLSYADRAGKKYRTTSIVDFSGTGPDRNFFANQGIRKAILLTEYVSLIKNWLLDTRQGCDDTVRREPPAPRPGQLLMNPDLRPESKTIATWERTSCPLTVSEGYRRFFTLFATHFQQEMAQVHDPALQRDLDVLYQLKGSSHEQQEKNPVDDWHVTPKAG